MIFTIGNIVKYILTKKIIFCGGIECFKVGHYYHSNILPLNISLEGHSTQTVSGNSYWVIKNIVVI